MLNLCVLIGNVTGDVRFNDENRPVAQFQIAVDRGFIGSDGEKADFLPVVAFDDLAVVQDRLCRRGRFLVVVGRTQRRRFRGSNGRDEFITEVVADYIRYLDEPPTDVINDDFYDPDELPTRISRDKAYQKNERRYEGRPNERRPVKRNTDHKPATGGHRRESASPRRHQGRPTFADISPNDLPVRRR